MSRPKAEITLWPLVGAFAVAYVACALHDGYRRGRGEPDKCILPAVRAVLIQALGLWKDGM